MIVRLRSWLLSHPIPPLVRAAGGPASADPAVLILADAVPTRLRGAAFCALTGADAKFYVWDLKTNKPVVAKGSWADQPEVKPQAQPAYLGRNTLTFPDGYIALGALDPALAGTFRVTLKDGKTVDLDRHDDMLVFQQAAE